MQPHQASDVSEFSNITQALSAATGLNWSPPPECPSFLHNGYYAQTEMTKAPHLVRRLRDLAIRSTGRSRAIIFERCGKREAAVNIPREVAENQAFIVALEALSKQNA